MRRYGNDGKFEKGKDEYGGALSVRDGLERRRKYNLGITNSVVDVATIHCNVELEQDKASLCRYLSLPPVPDSTRPRVYSNPTPILGSNFCNTDAHTAHNSTILPSSPAVRSHLLLRPAYMLRVQVSLS